MTLEALTDAKRLSEISEKSAEHALLRNKALKRGMDAAKVGVNRSTNPYPVNIIFFSDWFEGFDFESSFAIQRRFRLPRK